MGEGRVSGCTARGFGEVFHFFVQFVKVLVKEPVLVVSITVPTHGCRKTESNLRRVAVLEFRSWQ